MTIANLFFSQSYHQLSYSMLDTGDIAEFSIELIMGNIPLNFEAFVNVEVPEGTTAHDVKQSYMKDGALDFEKFIQNHGPLQFVPKAHNIDHMHSYGMDFLHIEHQEDFISPYSVEDNLILQNQVLEIYKKVAFMRESGIKSHFANIILGVAQSDDETDEYGIEDEELIIEPFLNLMLLQHQPKVRIQGLKLIAPRRILVNYLIEPNFENEVQVEINYPAVNLITEIQVDHNKSTYDVLEHRSIIPLIMVFDDEARTHYFHSLKEWIYDYNGADPKIQIHNQAQFDLKIAEIANRSIIKSMLSDSLFERKTLKSA